MVAATPRILFAVNFISAIQIYYYYSQVDSEDGGTAENVPLCKL